MLLSVLSQVLDEVGFMPDLSTAQAAELLGVDQSTVKLWCRSGRLPGARRELQDRGPVWKIPERNVRTFELPKRGRPRKPNTSGKNLNGKSAKSLSAKVPK